MTQRARLDQLKRSRSDLKHRTFQEQYEELERRAGHAHEPVATFGDLPTVGNKPGDECLVLNTAIKYYWDNGLQTWRPLLGKGYDIPSGLIKRHRGKVVAEGGEVGMVLSHRYDVGADTLDVYINGILQDVGSDYLEVNENTIEFVNELEQGMIITYMTPYVIGDAINEGELQQRLLQIEHNHYQLMMVNYYQGKPVDSQSLFFDGFVNTNYIDYLHTTSNVEYDNVKRTMRVKTNTVSKFQEVFDDSVQIDTTLSVLRLLNSEITLPISTALTTAFADDFSTSTKMALDATTAYWDPSLQQLAVDPQYAGGNHYPLGDFMGTTGGVERSGSYWNDAGCYSIAPTSNWMFMTHWMDMSIGQITRPYKNSSIVAGFQDQADSPAVSGYNGRSAWHIWGADGLPYDTVTGIRTLTYVKSADKLYFITETDLGGGRWAQRLYYFNRLTASFGAILTGYGNYERWNVRLPVPTNAAWPTGLPNTTGLIATDRIHSMGATATQLMIRVGDVVYFVNPSTFVVERVLDWSASVKKPSTYLANSKQFTADNRFLYFPWYGIDGFNNGLFFEVFDINDGRFIQRIFITTGTPGTTAMAYDFNKNRMMMGLWGGGSYWFTLDKPTPVAADYGSSSAYGGVMYFDSPATNFVVAQSQPIYTNLSKVDYKLSATQVLNGGVIEYFIRFNGAAWQKITLGTAYSWTNPKKTDSAVIELRVALKNAVGTSTSPTVTDWKLDIKQYEASGLYASKIQTLSLDKVTGGKLALNQTIPQETSLQWTMSLDAGLPDIPVAVDGAFSTPSNLSVAQAVTKATMATNNTLFSPVVRDFTLNLYNVNAARLESTVYGQLQDVEHATMWLTNSTSNDFVQPYMSRDGGVTWIEGKRDSSVKLPDGSFESQYHFVFAGAENIRNQAKVAFDLRGATEIMQYGVSLNPL